MHDSSICDFSVILPTFEKVRPAPVRNLSAAFVRDTVDAIIRDVDRFYKPRVVCRRSFTLYGVKKYYPDHEIKAAKQKSFLHKNMSGSGKVPKNKKHSYIRSISMYESSPSNDFNLYASNDFRSDKFISFDFITAERFSNYIQNNIPLYKSRDDISKNVYAVNLLNLNLNNTMKVKKRLEKTGTGLKKSYRKSFPLMSSNNEPVSWLNFHKTIWEYKFCGL